MKLAFKKKYFLIFIPLLLTLIAVSLYFFYQKISTMACNPSTSWICTKPYYDARTRTYFANGIIVNKYTKDNKYYLLTKLYNTKHQPVNVLFRLPPSQIQMAINSRYENKGIAKSHAVPEAYKIFSNGQQIMVDILTPTKEEANKASQVIHDKEYIQCLSHHLPIARYLYSPTLINHLLYLYDHFTSNCPVTLLTASV